MTEWAFAPLIESGASGGARRAGSNPAEAISTTFHQAMISIPAQSDRSLGPRRRHGWVGADDERRTTNDERRRHVPNPPTGSWQADQKKGGTFEIDARTRSRLPGQIKGKHTLFHPSSVHPFTSIARSTPLHSRDPYIIKPAVS
jgi:hypothetical protein